MHSVKQKVRLQLALKRLQTRLCQLRFELAGLDFPVAIFAIVRNCVRDQDDRYEGSRNVVDEIVQKQLPKPIPLDTEMMGVRVPDRGCPVTIFRLVDCIGSDPAKDDVDNTNKTPIPR